MTYYSDALKDRNFKIVTLPLNVYCSVAECNVLMREGATAKKLDGATFIHIACPGGAPKHTAAHKHPDTGLRFG